MTEQTEKKFTETLIEYAKGFGEWQYAMPCAKDGARLFVDSLWHTPDEDPEEGKDILLMYKAPDGRNIFHIGLFDSSTRKVFVSHQTSFHWQQITHFDKWVNIEDLLPDKSI